MSSTPELEQKTSFDEVDRAIATSSLQRVSGKGQVLLLEAKQLKTSKEVRKVLSEDKYIERLQKIIVRDYFPELPTLKAQNEYSTAVAVNDLSKIRELQLRYSLKRTDRRTSPTILRSPDVFDPDTPGPSLGKVKESKQKSSKKQMKKEDDELTVDSYLNKYTSEDNASFEELATLQNRKEQIRNAWMYEAEEKHNKEFVSRGQSMLKNADEQLMIAAAPGQNEDKPKDLDNWKYKARSALHFHFPEAPLTVEEHILRQKMNQKVINKTGTRFSEETRSKLMQNPSSKKTEGQALTNVGKVDVTGQKIENKGCAIDLVATPSIAPGVDASPFMTWGEIEGTPFRLDGNDITMASNAPAFKIPEVPVREKIAQSMTETIAKRYRDKRKIAIRQAERNHSKTPGFGSLRSTDKLQLMSPAARRLATQELGINLSTDKALRASYTPSPLRPGSTTPGSTHILRKTPKPMERIATPSDSVSSITDNLLFFGEASNSAKKTRPSAEDFF